MSTVSGTVSIERLKCLGLTAASDKLDTKRKQYNKLSIAYNEYEFVDVQAIIDFNLALHDKTLRTEKGTYGPTQIYDELKFTNLQAYAQVPPLEVLDKLQVAVERECFDSFEVAEIKTTRVVADPIIFGRVEGCSDRFFVAQWDDDVKFEDLVKHKKSVKV